MEPPTVREVIRRLEDEGFAYVGTRGDHRQYKKDGRRVTVAGKMGDHLDWGTWRSVRSQAGW